MNTTRGRPRYPRRGSAFALFNMTAVTMQQCLVPAVLLGRVTSLYGTAARGTGALGALAGGTLAAIAGIRAPMLAGAVPIAAVAILLAWRRRDAAPAADATQAPSPG